MATLQELLARLVEHEDLTAEETAAVMDSVLTDSASPIAMAAFLAALRVKRETPAEVAGLAAAMLDHAIRIEVPGRSVDIVGTGGDGFGTVNISTMASLVIAGSGLTVVKHGNRAATSKSGSADVLGELGVRLDLAPERVAELATEVGITFCFAQVFHPSMRFTMPIRKEIGVPTTFNILGPLTNPAAPKFQLTGAFNLPTAQLMADALSGLGVERAFVVHGAEGWDEPTPLGPFTVLDVRPGKVSAEIRSPSDYGLDLCGARDLAGGDAASNARALRAVLCGDEQGAHRDALLLGTALALEIVGKVSEPREGVRLARHAIDSGAARRTLEALTGFGSRGAQ